MALATGLASIDDLASDQVKCVLKYSWLVGVPQMPFENSRQSHGGCGRNGKR